MHINWAKLAKQTHDDKCPKHRPMAITQKANICSDRTIVCIYSDIVVGVCGLYVWATVSGRCRRLPPDGWWPLAVTGGISQYELCSCGEQTC